jgi:hypothetical protein
VTSNFNTPSTGQSFSETSKGYTDLSGLCASDPFAPLGESMNAGATIATSDSGLPGSTSEQTEGVPDRTPALGETSGDYTNDVS